MEAQDAIESEKRQATLGSREAAEQGGIGIKHSRYDAAQKNVQQNTIRYIVLSQTADARSSASE